MSAAAIPQVFCQGDPCCADEQGPYCPGHTKEEFEAKCQRKSDTDPAPAPPGPVDEPDVEDFIEGVKREMAYQAERWAERDRGRGATGWAPLVARFTRNVVDAALAGDRRLALHHVISAAAALGHWHAAIRRDLP